MTVLARRSASRVRVVASLTLLVAVCGCATGCAPTSAHSATPPSERSVTHSAHPVIHSATPRPMKVTGAGCSSLVTSWNSVMASLKVGPLDPNGWSTTAVPADFPVPDNDGRATTTAECGATDSTGESDVLAKYTLNDSGDWDTAYYYAVRFIDWTGSTADSPHTSGDWRSWTFSRSAVGDQALTTWILASGSTMYVAYSTATSAPAPTGGTGSITAVATFIGTTSACTGTDVHLSGPNGYSDDGQTGDDGTAIFSGLTPGTYAVTGGGGQAANPVVNGAGVATATVTVIAGGDQRVQFGCS